ncbi:hypothetical protein ACX801_07925 [Arthrobacter bambusae]
MYKQDHDLIDAVEEHPHVVAELVRLAAERRGIDPELAREVGRAPHLAEGIL